MKNLICLKIRQPIRIFLNSSDAFFPSHDGCWVGRKKTIFKCASSQTEPTKVKTTLFSLSLVEASVWKQQPRLYNDVYLRKETTPFALCMYIGRESNPSLEREGKWRRGRRGKERRAWRSCGRHQPILLSHKITSFATVPIPISSILLLFLKRKKNELLQFAEQFSGGGFIAQGGAMCYHTTSSSSLMSAAFSDSWISSCLGPILIFGRINMFVWRRRLKIVGPAKPSSICSPRSSKADLMITMYLYFSVSFISTCLIILIA